MKPSDALHTHRDAIRRAVEAHHVCNGRVFGSVIHGNDRDGSDLDLLVDTLPGTTLFDLGGLQVELEELLGIPIDVLDAQPYRPVTPKPCLKSRNFT